MIDTDNCVWTIKVTMKTSVIRLTNWKNVQLKQHVVNRNVLNEIRKMAT